MGFGLVNLTMTTEACEEQACIQAIAQGAPTKFELSALCTTGPNKAKCVSPWTSFKAPTGTRLNAFPFDAATNPGGYRVEWVERHEGTNSTLNWYWDIINGDAKAVRFGVHARNPNQNKGGLSHGKLIGTYYKWTAIQIVYICIFSQVKY